MLSTRSTVYSSVTNAEAKFSSLNPEERKWPFADGAIDIWRIIIGGQDTCQAGSSERRPAG